jgi:predicted HTH domain antitoxin
MSLVISDDIVRASGLTERELLLEIVLMLFGRDKISLGKASELMGMHRMQFQKLLDDRGICVHYDVAEFQEDFKTLQDSDWQ